MNQGDGDLCPQDPIHGRMWVMASRRQWCPSAKHKGSQFYEYDGKTPVHASWSPLDAAHPPSGTGDQAGTTARGTSRSRTGLAT